MNIRRMNGTGIEGKGLVTGRGLGKCKNNGEEEALNKLGKGMGKRRRTAGGVGKG
jgi:hypothetical protein